MQPKKISKKQQQYISQAPSHANDTREATRTKKKTNEIRHIIMRNGKDKDFFFLLLLFLLNSRRHRHEYSHCILCGCQICAFTRHTHTHTRDAHVDPRLWFFPPPNRSTFKHTACCTQLSMGMSEPNPHLTISPSIEQARENQEAEAEREKKKERGMTKRMREE